jgi:hypothetical protein
MSGEGKVIISPMERATEDHAVSGDYSRTERISTSSFGCGLAPVCKETKDYKGPWGLYYLQGYPTSGAQLSKQSALSQPDISAADSAAATQAWANTSNHSADILQDIAEIEQTFRLLRNPLQTGHAFIDKITSKNARRLTNKSGQSVFGTAADAYSYASSMWLQYRYGVRPLISSISGILKELQKTQRPVRNTSRGKYTLHASNTSQGTLTYNASKNTYQTTVSDSYDVSCGIVIDEVIDIAQALGVDASGMLSLPWELVPYSFVADWFINVGAFLRAVIPFTSKSPVGSWTKKVRTQTVTFQITGSVAASPTQFNLLRGANELWNSTWITTTRTPGIVGPSVVFKPFAYKDVLADARVIDSLTLLTQKMDRVFRH